MWSRRGTAAQWPPPLTCALTIAELSGGPIREREGVSVREREREGRGERQTRALSTQLVSRRPASPHGSMTEELSYLGLLHLLSCSGVFWITKRRLLHTDYWSGGHAHWLLLRMVLWLTALRDYLPLEHSGNDDIYPELYLLIGVVCCIGALVDPQWMAGGVGEQCIGLSHVKCQPLLLSQVQSSLLAVVY